MARGSCDKQVCTYEMARGSCDKQGCTYDLQYPCDKKVPLAAFIRGAEVLARAAHSSRMATRPYVDDTLATETHRYYGTHSK